MKVNREALYFELGLEITKRLRRRRHYRALVGRQERQAWDEKRMRNIKLSQLVHTRRESTITRGDPRGPRFFTNSSSSLMRKKQGRHCDVWDYARMCARARVRACVGVRCKIERWGKRKKDADRYPPSLLLSFTSLLSFSPGSLVTVEPTAFALFISSFFILYFFFFFFLHQVSTKLPPFFFLKRISERMHRFSYDSLSLPLT